MVKAFVISPRKTLKTRRMREGRLRGEALADRIPITFLVLPSDNAATPPHQCNSAVIQVPVFGLGRFSQEHETLSI